MKTSNKAKLMAILAVSLMLAVCIVPFNDSENGMDAVVGDGGTYSYTITYDSSKMSADQATSSAISVANMEAIYHPSYSGGTVSGYGDWTWDTTTGLGPFNSFYGAFDLTNGNSFYAILDPFDLTKTISGETLSSLTSYNIMWVLPTVYWSTTSTSITLTNDSATGGTAYAHTINGHVYKYIAIGVNEGSTTTVDGQTVLTSTSGTSPTVSQTRATFRTYAHNYTMSSDLATDPNYPAYSMQWTFYQWELYKYCSWTLMENFNSQAVVGGGHTYGSTYVFTTGATNTLGPYAGTPMASSSVASTTGGNSVKLFIENAWGGVREFVDGVVINGKSGYYVDTKDTPNDANTAGTYVEYFADALPSSNGYPTSIVTSRAQTWGMGGSSTSTTENYGLTDYTYTSTSADRVLDVGGNSSTTGSASVRYGLSYAAANGGLSDFYNALGSRLAFVFDAGPASPTTEIDVDLAISDSGYGTLSDGTQTGQTAISLTGITAGAVTISEANKSITIDGYTITATPTTADDHWTYTFDGWYVGQTKLIDGNTLSADTSITAKFTRSLTLHDAQVESNNTSWGTVSIGTLVDIPWGETFTVTDHTLTIYNQSVVAIEEPDTVRFEYSFDGFHTEGQLITTGMAMTKDLTIRAIFTSTELRYTVIIQSNNTDWGTVDVASITNIPGGSSFTVSDNTLEVGGTTVTATKKATDPEYTYGFSGWYDALTGGNQITSLSTVTGNMNVYARFTATINTYTVTIQDDGSSYGAVSPASVANVPYGTIVTASGNALNVHGTPVTATPSEDTTQYDYSFTKWTVGQTDLVDSYQITGNTTITANFDRELQKYTVTFGSNDTSMGTVSPSFIGQVPYGSGFSVNGNQITINGSTATANHAENTPEVSYFFSSWSVGSGDTVTGDMTVTATFTSGPSVYTVTVQANDSSYGSVSNPITPNMPYGTVITIDGDEVEIGSTTSKATPRSDTAQYDYGFNGWKVDGIAVTGTYTVTGDVTFVADFTRVVNTYTITWSIDGVDTTETYEYGATPSHEIPTKEYYVFAGWVPTIEMVTKDQTYTATWTASLYPVYFNGNGGTPSTEIARGSADTPVVLPTATFGQKYLAGWYTYDNTLVGYQGDNYFPTTEITLYAQWSDVVLYHFSVVYNANGGQGGPSFSGFSSETLMDSKEFTVSSVKPSYGGYNFLGWATSPDATSVQYEAGDIVNVSTNSSVTLYAVWGEKSDAQNAYEAILSMVPIIMIVGVLVGITGVVFKAKTEGTDMSEFTGLVIGVSVIVIMIAFVLMPILGTV